MSLQQTRETLLAYAQANLTHAEAAEFFSDMIVSTIMNTGEQACGRIAVAEQIAILQARASDLKPKSAIIGEGHAAVEIDFVTADTAIIPYSIIYDFEAGKITAIRFYFAGNVPT
ncbi:hypothetical protein SE17_05770 [Kouleothrix aurantiaca]|uniref:SnoaL-like domain-containing protein n=1 Tax=Kouleothrix aurantiaca TaxID=186479 RepID=A0A0P9DKR0_9CHLR|nr:hypothetical protein SE17_05770 [Kouleothrix aurantiaca]